MTPNQVYAQFTDIFPNYVSEDITYFPNGRNCIRIKGIEALSHISREFVFQFNSINDWKFETFESFFKRMKGEKA